MGVIALQGGEQPLTLMQRWPVRTGRPYGRPPLSAVRRREKNGRYASEGAFFRDIIKSCVLSECGNAPIGLTPCGDPISI